MQERALKPRTAYDYNRYIKNAPKPGKPRFFRDWLDMPLVKITDDMVATKYTKLKASDRGTAQASSAMRVLRSVINFAIEAYDLDIINPVTTLSKRRAWVKGNKRRTHLHLEEVSPFVTALRQVPNPVMAAYLEFILFTGCRRSEAATLKWQNVNMAANVLTFTKTKNGEDRSIPISTRVRDILKHMQRLKMGDYVFASVDKNGKHSHVTEPRKVLARANAGAGTKISTHDLRRTFSTIMESLDCPMTPLKALLGHSQNQDVTTGHYIVMNTERLRQWTDKYDAYLQRLIVADKK